ncbi:MAG: OB-fold nucleic acid binding domain-containing protein [Firmicutes bacterium]|nr:OB-fold nucleic acid binding domain-containing protein [Bacillota bacterium]
MSENILELTTNLSFYHSTAYRFMRFRDCTYNEDTDTLSAVFLYESDLHDRVEALRPKLEEAFIAEVEQEIGKGTTFIFEYERSYIDEILLQLQLKSFLSTSFAVLGGLNDEDVLVTVTDDGYSASISIPSQCIDYVKSHKLWIEWKQILRAHHFATFTFHFHEKAVDDTPVDLSQFDVVDMPTGPRVDKTMPVGNIEYYLGVPIKERPIRIQYLRVTAEDQVIAGKIKFLKQREFTKKTEDGDETKTFWTFVLDDGKDRTQCVFFPNQNSFKKFEKLTEDTAVALIGTNTERNGSISFRVRGVSLAMLK